MITVEYSSDGDCPFTGTKCCGFGEYFDEDMVEKCTDTEDGYLVEISFPLEDFPFDGTETFGFGLRVNKVATLVNNVQAAGSYETQFAAHDWAAVLKRGQ